jgi:predicted metal-dependent enzyme (double-stranded beta helix superfamily)
MTTIEWLVDRNGTPLPLQTQTIKPTTTEPTTTESTTTESTTAATNDQPYRLYRFLTDVEDILTRFHDPIQQLQQISPRVQQLLESSSWLQVMPIAPDPETGWSVITLYDEPMFPLTIQMVAWAPGSQSPIHNHGCWGLVAIISGQEKNQFWQRDATSTQPDRITPTASHTLQAGEIMAFLPEAIHQITAIGDQPTISFNLYGETDYDQRFEFDPSNDQATIY